MMRTKAMVRMQWQVFTLGGGAILMGIAAFGLFQNAWNVHRHAWAGYLQAGLVFGALTLLIVSLRIGKRMGEAMLHAREVGGDVCMYCLYDMSAHEGDVCPECGCRFDAHETHAYWARFDRPRI